MPGPVTVIELSANAKTGPVSATYAAQVTCPKSCPFMGSGCYAETGMVGFQTARLNRASDGHTKLGIAKLEAAGIAKLTGKSPLRLHVVGDATTNQSAKVLAKASSGYAAKHGSKVWTYTHAWRKVARASWGAVSVLASCETIADARAAMQAGYGAAIVLDSHADSRAYVVDGVKVVPCPQQTGRAATCLDCGLCFKDGMLRDSGAVIGFAAHGSQVKRVRSQLVQIGA